MWYTGRHMLHVYCNSKETRYPPDLSFPDARGTSRIRLYRVTFFWQIAYPIIQNHRINRT